MTVYNGQEMGREFGWDDVIEKESDFVVLPKGTYDYQIKLVERGRHEPKPGAPENYHLVIKQWSMLP